MTTMAMADGGGNDGDGSSSNRAAAVVGFAMAATATAAVGRRYLLTSLGCLLYRALRFSYDFHHMLRFSGAPMKMSVCMLCARCLCVRACVSVTIDVCVCMRVLRWQCHTNCNNRKPGKGKGMRLLALGTSTIETPVGVAMRCGRGT